MTTYDLFGLNQENKIQESGCREVFTPHEPIKSLDLFLGRQKEVNSLIEYLNTPGQHALLFGDRGVGKSSLAFIASYLILDHIITGKLYYERCDSWSTFSSIIENPMCDVGIDLSLQSETSTRESAGKAGLKIPALSAGVGSARKTSKTYNRINEITPSYAARHLSELSGLLVIDEADLLKEPSDRHKLAEFIKQLSDLGSKFKVLIVGVAKTGGDLIGAHPSVQRCLRETLLGRMSNKELRQIVEKGAKKIGLIFDVDVVNNIVALSYGYPHFTHLLALKCAEDVISAGSYTVRYSDLRTAITEAVTEAEASLRRTYEEAVRSGHTDRYKNILSAASKIDESEFSAARLREEISLYTDEEIKSTSLNYYMKRLVSDDGSCILRRKARGFYVFTDPRMRVFIRLNIMATKKNT